MCCHVCHHYEIEKWFLYVRCMWLCLWSQPIASSRAVTKGRCSWASISLLEFDGGVYCRPSSLLWVRAASIRCRVNQTSSIDSVTADQQSTTETSCYDSSSQTKVCVLVCVCLCVCACVCLCSCASARMRKSISQTISFRMVRILCLCLVWIVLILLVELSAMITNSRWNLFILISTKFGDVTKLMTKQIPFTENIFLMLFSTSTLLIRLYNARWRGRQVTFC